MHPDQKEVDSAAGDRQCQASATVTTATATTAASDWPDSDGHATEAAPADAQPSTPLLVEPPRRKFRKLKPFVRVSEQFKKATSVHAIDPPRTRKRNFDETSMSLNHLIPFGKRIRKERPESDPEYNYFLSAEERGAPAPRAKLPRAAKTCAMLRNALLEWSCNNEADEELVLKPVGIEPRAEGKKGDGMKSRRDVWWNHRGGLS